MDKVNMKTVAKAIFVVVVIVLIIALWYLLMKPTDEMSHAPAAAVPVMARGIKTASSPGAPMPEVKLMAENGSFFGAGYPNGTYECAMTCDGIDYDLKSFGSHGYDYKDWVRNEAVDPQTLKNHAEWSKDIRRNDGKTNITGRTWSPDSHTSYDPIPWIGLRRPQNVPVCNPTQVADVDYNLYSDASTFVWKSS